MLAQYIRIVLPSYDVTCNDVANENDHTITTTTTTVHHRYATLAAQLLLECYA